MCCLVVVSFDLSVLGGGGRDELQLASIALLPPPPGLLDTQKSNNCRVFWGSTGLRTNRFGCLAGHELPRCGAGQGKLQRCSAVQQRVPEVGQVSGPKQALQVTWVVKIKPPRIGPKVLVFSIFQGLRHFGVILFLTTTAT